MLEVTPKEFLDGLREKHTPGGHEHDQQSHAGSGGGSDKDEGGRDSGDRDKPKSDYGLRPGDAAKFRGLKAEWAQINNKLLEHIDKPDSPQAQALSRELESTVQAIQKLRADPGTPAGIGLPGGPRDVVIIGAGPGGLAASINGAAEGLDTLVIEANAVPGGQAKFSSRIENFPGFPVGITGERLTQNMFTQAQRLGAEAQLGVRVTGLTHDAGTGLKHLTLSNGTTIESRTVIMAGGLEFRRVPFPGSDGPGVIVGDGKALAEAGKGGSVCVIGGSNGAAQAALGAAQNCDHVYVLARSPIAGSMSDYQIEALRSHPKITVIESDTVSKLWRDEQGNPQRLETANGQNLPVKAVGQFLGSVPETKWLPADITRDKGGRLQTSTNLETGIPGVYAIGDIRAGAIGRVGISVGEGQLALREANVHLDALRKKADGESATKAYNPPPISTLIADLFTLDRDEPWFGQTVEGVKPPEPKKAKSWDEVFKHTPGGHEHDQLSHGRGGDGGDSDSGGKGEHPGKGYTAGAYVKNGVIHTRSVYDAQRALHEDRKVQLDQPRKVSVLIQKLGEVSKKMIERGEKAPVFNLCNVGVKGTNLFCADTKGIPRVEMPQLDEQQTKDFQKYLKSEGYKVSKEKQFASHLRATQNELNGGKVAHGAQKIQENGGKVKSIIVSDDDYILDGHHAWAAKLGLDAADNKLENDLKMNVVRVDIKITKLLEEADKFTGGKGRKGVDESTKSLGDVIGEMFSDWEERHTPGGHEHDQQSHAGGGGEGAGYEFVSPNVGELKFDGAVKELGSARQGVLNDATKDINEQLDIAAQTHDVVGAWKDGAENSTMSIITGSNWEKIKLSASMKGWVADQKSVLIFQERSAGDGDSALARFEAQGNLTEIHENLLADGVENHTLVPTATGATVYVADLENNQSAAIKQAASRYGENNPIGVRFGRGEFVGAPYDYQGSDRETRDAARDVYEANIERSPVPGGQAVWQGVRDRWGKALAESDTSLTSRTIFVRPDFLRAFEALTAALASGAEAVPYCGEYIPGTELIDLSEWEERHTPGGHEHDQQSHAGSGGGSEKESDGSDRGEGKPHEPSAEAMAVGGDEWNKQTAERLEKEYVEAAPKIDKIVSDAMAALATVEMPAVPNPDIDDEAPVVPDSWEMLSDDQQEGVKDQWMSATKESYYDSEVENWQENSATDDAGNQLAWQWSKGKNEQWAIDGIEEARTVLEDQAIPFTNKQLMNALVVEYDSYDNTIEKGLKLSFDDSKIGKPIGWQEEQGTLPGIEPQKPEAALTKDMRETLIAELTTTFEKEADDVKDKLEPPDYLGDSVAEFQEDSWSSMSDKEKWFWTEGNTDTVKDLQQEYDDYYEGSAKPMTGQFYMPNKLDPMQEGGDKGQYSATQKVARYLSIERAAQVMVERGIYDDDGKARADAIRMDNILWTGWKGSSSGQEGQLLQQATADELGGRLNPMMVSLTQSNLDNFSVTYAPNATKSYDAVKAYVRGKWETSQFLLKKAGLETVNVYRAVNIPDTAPPSVFQSGTGPGHNVATTKTFDSETEANSYVENQTATHGKNDLGSNSGYRGEVNHVHNVYRVKNTHYFSSKPDADGFAEKYAKDPANPEQHREIVKEVSPQTGNVLLHQTRLPDIHVDRNGAASTTTDLRVANKWDGTDGRVVLRASVPRTAVVSVPAYGINVQGEHEVVIAGTAWKGWDSWYGVAPSHENIKIGHQIVGDPRAGA